MFHYGVKQLSDSIFELIKIDSIYSIKIVLCNTEEYKIVVGRGNVFELS